MNRIDQKFIELRAKKQKAFIAFVTAGDPNLKTTEELVLEFEHSGVDIVELGVPFSDPLADGPTIQAASQRSLKNGTTLKKVLSLVARLRKQTEIPIALMMYYNQIHFFGESKFIDALKECGVDGLIVPDLPPEEARNLIKLAKSSDISTVFFMSPTTKPDRMKAIADVSTGFIYYVSLTGVTGARQALPSSVAKQIKLAKKSTVKPICVGFGVSTREQIKSMTKIADGVIVGSAIINEIVKNSGKKSLVKNVAKFVSNLASATKK